MFQGLEYVMAVYEEKSFSKAAKKLFISQPSLSANIKRIEKKLGLPIFDRSTIPLTLTEFGHEYITKAQEIARIEDDFAKYISDYSNLQRGKLIFGGTSLFASLILPKLMAEFSQTYPNLDLDLVEETTNTLVRMLNDGQIDILIDNTELDAEIFDRVLYGHESLFLAIPGDFPINQELKEYQFTAQEIRQSYPNLTHKPSLPLHLMEDQPFVLLKEDNDTGERARQICQDNDFEPLVSFQVDQQMTAYNITSSGMAVSFVGTTLISKTPGRDNVIYYRLDDQPAHRNLYFYWKRDRYHSNALRKFIELIK
ncbi:LysR family transcriptional regulator [Ignavigranum ruoffiae]|uniref:LysR family transcriptional regulator n=1 Tax=Ignavigranum ruoffiae TaxID=89093 RepID=UPI002352BF0E|nr:LysR family transcriptional regulator [Ignavigranum ruoffiae]